MTDDIVQPIRRHSMLGDVLATQDKAEALWREAQSILDDEEIITLLHEAYMTLFSARLKLED